MALIDVYQLKSLDDELFIIHSIGILDDLTFRDTRILFVDSTI